MYARRFMEVGLDSFKSPIAIVALPGIANVGKIAIETLSQILRAEHMMDFFSKDFPPRVLVKKGISTIPIEQHQMNHMTFCFLQLIFNHPPVQVYTSMLILWQVNLRN